MNSKIFRCYSSPLMKELTSNGCRYEFVAKDIVNGKTFWAFLKTPLVDQVLTEWSKNNPNK